MYVRFAKLCLIKPVARLVNYTHAQLKPNFEHNRAYFVIYPGSWYRNCVLLMFVTYRLHFITFIFSFTGCGTIYANFIDCGRAIGTGVEPAAGDRANGSLYHVLKHLSDTSDTSDTHFCSAVLRIINFYIYFKHSIFLLPLFNNCVV